MLKKGKRLVLVSSYPPQRFKELELHAECAEMSDYITNTGEKKHGWVSPMVLHLIKGNPPYPVERFYVHPGQIIKWQGYSVYIEDIEVTPEELKKYEEILRQAAARGYYPPGIRLGSIIVWVKRGE